MEVWKKSVAYTIWMLFVLIHNIRVFCILHNNNTVVGKTRWLLQLVFLASCIFSWVLPQHCTSSTTWWVFQILIHTLDPLSAQGIIKPTSPPYRNSFYIWFPFQHNTTDLHILVLVLSPTSCVGIHFVPYLFTHPTQCSINDIPLPSLILYFPHSLFLKPIELFWSKLKAGIRCELLTNDATLTPLIIESANR